MLGKMFFEILRAEERDNNLEEYCKFNNNLL